MQTPLFGEDLFSHTFVRSAYMFLWKEMFRGFSICHIKAETPLGTILPPVPNFLSPRHNVVPHQLRFMWFLLSYCWQNSPVYPLLYGKSAAVQTQQSKWAGDILNPLSQTHDAMLEQFTPSLTLLRVYHLKESAEQRSLQHKGMKEGFVVLIKVNGWERKPLGHWYSHFICVLPHGEGHIEVLLCLLQGPRSFV